MNIKIIEEFASIDVLAEYGKVSISFSVNSIFAVKAVNEGLGGLNLVEENIETPWIKDYDESEKPVVWAEKWDIKNWAVLSVFENEKRIGGALVAYNTNGVNMLEGRDDISVLWDFRIHPDYRRKGIGRELFSRVVQWSKKKKCKLLKIETQNINVPACKFYSKQGATLGTIKIFAYQEHPEETMLMWYLDLSNISN